MQFFWKSYDKEEWQGPIECEHIIFHVQFIYLYKHKLARGFIKTFDTTKLYKFSIE